MHTGPRNRSRHRDEILPGVPVVFGGVNDFHPAMLEKVEGITGVAEVQDTLGTLLLALHPGTRGIFAVHDYTSSGLAEAESSALCPS